MGNKGKFKYTDEEIVSEAKKYTRTEDLKTHARWAYDALRTRGLFKRATLHMTRPIRWSRATAVKYMEECTSVEDFYTRFSGGYGWVCTNDKSLLKKYLTYTHEWRTDAEVIAALRKYKTQAEAGAHQSHLLGIARQRGVLEEASRHFIPFENGKPIEYFIELAKPYKYRREFKLAHKGAYSTCLSRGFLPAVCAHMEYKNQNWVDNKEEVMQIARQYQTRQDFIDGNEAAYSACKRHGWLEEACAYMEYGVAGYSKNKPGILYYLKFLRPSFNWPIYKLGITNRPVKERLWNMGIPKNVTTLVIAQQRFEDGKECYDLEQSLLKEFSSFKYRGTPFLGNGNTELFVRDVMGFDWP